jgi:Family of unknown function (DUF6065)
MPDKAAERISEQQQVSEESIGAAIRLDPPELTCYRIRENAPAIVPGGADRGWMDQSQQRFAYRCTPLSIANASGWEIINPHDFSASWDGDTSPHGVTVRSPGNGRGAPARSHFGEGVLTFHTGYLFRTNPGWAVWARGVPNLVKDGITPLEGLVETDWLPMPFTMNWRFTRPGTVRFEAGEPFCFITLTPHAQLDHVSPRLARLADNPDLKAAYQAWNESRSQFLTQLAAGEPEAVKQGWQRHYVRGQGPEQQGVPGYHLSKRRLRAPKA